MIFLYKVWSWPVSVDLCKIQFFYWSHFKLWPFPSDYNDDRASGFQFFFSKVLYSWSHITFVEQMKQLNSTLFLSEQGYMNIMVTMYLNHSKIFWSRVQFSCTASFEDIHVIYCFIMIRLPFFSCYLILQSVWGDMLHFTKLKWN